MKLYYAPGACSLADHIALHEAGLPFVREKVDLTAKRTESGADFLTMNPKGYVPALTLDSGETLTENVAILDWIAHQRRELAPAGPLGYTQLLQMLAFIATEIHKSFKPLVTDGRNDDKMQAKSSIIKRMDYLAGNIEGDYLFGDSVSVADFYLFVMLLWAKKFDVQVPGQLTTLRERLMSRPSVQLAMRYEGL